LFQGLFCLSTFASVTPELITKNLRELSANGGHLIARAPYTQALSGAQEQKEIFGLRRQLYKEGNCNNYVLSSFDPRLEDGSFRDFAIGAVLNHSERYMREYAYYDELQEYVKAF